MTRSLGSASLNPARLSTRATSRKSHLRGGGSRAERRARVERIMALILSYYRVPGLFE